MSVPKPRPRLRTGRLLGLTVVGLVLVAAGVVAIGRVTGPGEFAFADIPEAGLHYPGSTVISDTDLKASGPSHAMRVIILGSDAPWQDIQAFYEDAYLDRPGWENDLSSSRYRGTNEIQVCTWHNHAVTVRLSFWDVDEWLEEHPGQRRWATVYDMTILDTTRDKTRPRPCLNSDH